jgi:hypothetical protein
MLLAETEKTTDIASPRGEIIHRYKELRDRARVAGSCPMNVVNEEDKIRTSDQGGKPGTTRFIMPSVPSYRKLS